jgi:hypothetical protein
MRRQGNETFKSGGIEVATSEGRDDHPADSELPTGTIGGHPRMPMTERAKIFMPFNPLKGFSEALREKERIVVEEDELTEERQAETSRVLASLERGDMVSVVHYEDGSYLKSDGAVLSVDQETRTLRLTNASIPFERIRTIEPA